MGRQIIVQSDGKLCVWSTFTDSIVIADATDEELIEHEARRAAEQSRTKTRDLINLVRNGRALDAYGRHAMAYWEALERNREPLP